eukprot:m.101392 g.101392  ORF g.101392 m.101392 type:complete len:58 (-) comp15164_c0_seq2:1014-1187(-)
MEWSQTLLWVAKRKHQFTLQIVSNSYQASATVVVSFIKTYSRVDNPNFNTSFSLNST